MKSPAFLLPVLASVACSAAPAPPAQRVASSDSVAIVDVGTPVSGPKGDVVGGRRSADRGIFMLLNTDPDSTGLFDAIDGGSDIGAAFGAGGIGIAGTEETDGGAGQGIGLGGLGRLGHGGGTAQGGANVTPGSTNGAGRLPPDLIQRIVRKNTAHYRLCYEKGLARAPSLAGKVAIHFLIGRDGSTSNVFATGSTLPDHAVVECLVAAFASLSFPQPEAGVVSVEYPLVFTAGD